MLIAVIRYYWARVLLWRKPAASPMKSSTASGAPGFPSPEQFVKQRMVMGPWDERPKYEKMLKEGDKDRYTALLQGEWFHEDLTSK